MKISWAGGKRKYLFYKTYKDLISALFCEYLGLVLWQLRAFWLYPQSILHQEHLFRKPVQHATPQCFQFSVHSENRQNPLLNVVRSSRRKKSSRSIL